MTLIDAMGGGDNAALRGLPEHLGQSHHWYGTRRDYIREHLPRSHGGKLVDIANDQQSSGAGTAFMSACISMTSTMEASSITSRSQSRGLSSPRLNPPVLGSTSSSR